MEHILQIAIGVDDDKIVKQIERSAESQITKSLGYEVAKVILKRRSGYGLSPKDIDAECSYSNLEFTPFGKEVFLRFLEENKERIITVAGEMLADKLVRTKAVKEKVGEVLAS